MQALVQTTLSRWFTDPYRAAQPVLTERIGATIRNTAVEGDAGYCAAIATMDHLQALPTLQTQRLPALVIVGEAD